MAELHDEEFWPDTLYEIEPQTEVDRLNASLKVRRKFDATFEGQLEPGERIKLIVSDLEVEMGEDGRVSLFVEDKQIWTGNGNEIEHVHTYRIAQTDELQIVAVNGKIVWVRQP